MIAEQRFRRIQLQGEELIERQRHLDPGLPRALHQLERLPKPLPDFPRVSARNRSLDKPVPECR